MNRKIFSKIAIVLVVSSFTLAFTIGKDKLHKRDFTVSVIDGKKPKAIPDEISFKDGKVYAGDAVGCAKLGACTWIKYEMVKDSTYTEEGEEREYIEILATSEFEGGELFEFKCVVDNFEIEGTMKITKKGKDKKTATFSGKEKVKKDKKKDKKEKDEK